MFKPIDSNETEGGSSASSNSAGFNQSSPFGFGQPSQSIFGANLASGGAPSTGFSFSSNQPLAPVNQSNPTNMFQPTNALFGGPSSSPQQSLFNTSNSNQLFTSNNSSQPSLFSSAPSQSFGSNNASSFQNSPFPNPQNQSSGLFGTPSSTPLPGSSTSTGFSFPQTTPQPGNSTPAFGSNTGTLSGSTSNNVPNSSSGLFGSTSSNGVQNSASTPTGLNAPAQSGLFSSQPNSSFGCSPGPFSRPGLFSTPPPYYPYYPHQLFGPINNIPPFEDFPVNTRRSGYNISLISAEENSDFQISVNKFDYYKVSSSLLSDSSDYFKTLLSKNIYKLDLEFPFPNAIHEVLFWLVYKCDEKLTNYISSFRVLLEVYSVFRLLQINESVNFLALLLSHGKSRNLFNCPALFPAVLNKNYIDLNFLCQTFSSSTSSSLFSNNTQPFLKIAMMFEWLSEKDCESEEDIETLISSKEYSEVAKKIRSLSLYSQNLNEYAALITRYPIASKILTLQHVLSGLNLLTIT